ncbi:sugar porter family MFS transporter [Propionimicrobium sp. PCR01-08-3]|uniref:sugar porter family MFS transporter n=1 Tax=Propionimicrobium sp. PCR01-08-3 TaxID=3052086 RepID=UPI00255CFED6|nr:sugar porter family MFS transporter [Propionimicrobium sp. PCR01-08-3]WIY82315.1 sugar porter family MFS transporter [Propionimicrobium sp. PCR01-08-3]
MSDTAVLQKSSGANSLVIRSAIVASIGGLIFGFDTAVISGTTTSLERVFNLSSSGLGFTVAIATIGTIVGAMFSGQLADKYGRHKMLFIIGSFYIIGALGTALAPESATGHNLFMLFRFLGGIGVGMSSVCAPIYTAEIAPPSQRGRLVGLVQLNIVIGILLAYLSNYIIRQIVSEENAWRWMLGVMAFPAVIFLLLLLTVPETPRWLMAHGRENDAVAISRKLCRTQEESDGQVAEIRAQIQADINAKATKVPFFTKRYRKVILMAFAIAMFNQLSGVNAILYYAPVVMQQAGASDNASYLMSVAVGFMNLVATMTALTVIDRIGRRSLMIVGSIGYLISLGFLTIIMFFYEGRYDSTSSVLVLVGLLCFIAAHAFGQGSVIWVFISEIFPNRVRGRGQSFGSLTHWTFAAITTYAFPPVLDILGGGVGFAIFFCFMCAQLFWVLKVMPETKGVPLEEMETKLGLDK